MGKDGYEEWRQMKRSQQIDRGEIQDTTHFKRVDTDGYKVRVRSDAYGSLCTWPCFIPWIN